MFLGILLIMEKIRIIIFVCALLLSSCAHGDSYRSYPERLLYLKIDQEKEIAEVKISGVIWTVSNNKELPNYSPVDYEVYEPVGFSLKNGAIVRIGVVEEIFLRVQGEYYYISLHHKNMRYCWDRLPNGGLREPMLLYSEEGLEFEFKAEMSKSRSKSCRERNTVRRITEK